jgi:beta-ribofuranosylaminobenzene 5'-phosphate synthase
LVKNVTTRLKQRKSCTTIELSERQKRKHRGPCRLRLSANIQHPRRAARICIIYMMIRVCAPSRLHFGLLSLSSAEKWPNLLGEPAVPARRFGGVGLMLERPGIQLTAQPSADWSAQGALAERALTYARRFAQTFPAEVVRPHRLIIESTAPEHMGLGTGTQLGMAVARALAVAFGMPDMDAVELAKRAGRGRRSGVGVHGFARGGLVVEAGWRQTDEIAPLVARVPFPQTWRVVVVLPPWGSGLHGREEEEAFAPFCRQPIGLETTESLCRLILLGMLPTLLQGDPDGFGEALYDFNQRAGQAFAAVQGGAYASRQIGELVTFVRRQGIRGVGQSSWGPAVFAVTKDPDQAMALAERLRDHLRLGFAEVLVTPASNHGSAVERNDQPTPSTSGCN